jgi:hypothetical protein
MFPRALHWSLFGARSIQTIPSNRHNRSLWSRRKGQEGPLLMHSLIHSFIHTIPSYLSEIHFIIVHPHTPWPWMNEWMYVWGVGLLGPCTATYNGLLCLNALVFPVVSLFLTFHEYPICIPRIPHSCYMPCPPHPPWLDHSNSCRRRCKLRIQKRERVCFVDVHRTAWDYSSSGAVVWNTSTRQTHEKFTLLRLL